MSRQSCEEGLAKAVSHYQAKMEQYSQEFPIPTETLLKCHDFLLQESEGIFHVESKASGTEMQAAYRKKLCVRDVKCYCKLNQVCGLMLFSSQIADL